MGRRSILFRFWAALSLAWICWCLYWPLYARKQDLRDAATEVEATYKTCLQQPGVSASDCARDRESYAELQRKWVAPPDENPYQTFAGKDPIKAGEFLAVLALGPPLITYFAAWILQVVVGLIRSSAAQASAH